MAFYITGDCHGDFQKIKLFCGNHNTSKADYMIILGDAGINYWLSKSDEKLKEKLSNLPISFLLIHGNHEARPYDINSYMEMEWHGGIVYYERKYPNLLFAKDGEIYDFDGRKGIAIGGAYSVDKEYRIMTGLPWFENEQPSAEIKCYVELQLEKCDWTVDYVLSHTCPTVFEPVDLYLEFIDQGRVDKSTENWLGSLQRKTNYKKWYFGHFHGNRVYPDGEMLFEVIKELGSDTFLQRLGHPLYKKGEGVLFYDDNNKEIYGRIVTVNKYGTASQTKEVSYDIKSVYEILHKDVAESDIEECNFY